MIKLTILGQARGGKNNIGVSRSGFRYPNKLFSLYKKDACSQLENQVFNYPMIKDKSFKYIFDYTPEDNRRRDATAILDGLFHIMEKLSIVEDDKLIKDFFFKEHPADKKDPKVVITIMSEGDYSGK